MRLYPLFISLAGCRVLVAGAGRVGRRKIAGLREAEARDILVFDPGLALEAEQELSSLPGVRVFRRAVTEEDLDKCRLVFAATDSRDENRRLAALCAARDILCNVVDDPENGTFHVPAHTRLQNLTAAFSTGGRSPALAGRIRKDATVWLEQQYGQLLVFMERLRPLVLAMDNGPERHGELFRVFADSNLGEALARKDSRAARETVAMLLPPSLHGHTEELLDGLC